ncbi:DUF58 domain-containing protein [Salinispira pacifica]
MNVRLIGVYIFSLSLSFLAGIYFGPYLFFIFVLLLLFPIVLVASTLIPFTSIDVNQKWSASKPVRGEQVSARLFVVNRSVLPMPGLHVEFETDMREKSGELVPLDLNLRPRTSHNVALTLLFPHRGAYKLGVESITAADPAGFVRVSRTIETRPYLVYPRVHQLRHFSTVVTDVLGGSAISADRHAGDLGNFVQLREYRDGESIRQISWRKYASTGKPFLREYEREQKNGVILYLDTAPAPQESPDPAEHEDAAVEVFLSLVRYLTEHRVPLFLRAPGNPELERMESGPEGFDKLVRSSIFARFLPHAGLDALIEQDQRKGLLSKKIVVAVTHTVDMGVRNTLENGTVSDLKLVLNCAGLSTERQRSIKREATGLFGERADLYVVDNADYIASVLEGSGHGVALKS